MPRGGRNNSVCRPQSSATVRSRAALHPGAANSVQPSQSVAAASSIQPLRVDLPDLSCSEAASIDAADPLSAGASADCAGESRELRVDLPPVRGSGNSGTTVQQPTHIASAAADPAYVDPPSGDGGGSDAVPGGGFWALRSGEAAQLLDSAYSEAVSWKRNLFIVPFGAEGEDFVKELSRLIGLFTDGSGARAFAWSAVVVACHLLLQRPFNTSAAADHRKFLRKRLSLWSAGNLSALLRESRCIQAHLPMPHSGGSAGGGLDDVQFAKLVYGDRLGTAAHYVEEGGGGGVLSLSSIVDGQTVLETLRAKHPDPVPPEPSVLLPDGPPPPDNVLYEAITSTKVRATIMAMKGAAGPSALDSEAWRRMASMYGAASKALCTSLAHMARCLCVEEIDPSHLRAFLAGRLIPLDKQPGVRPIAIGEVFRRVVGKVIMAVIERDVAAVTVPRQLCVGVPSACEVAVQALTGLYERDEDTAILLVDASNALNALNRAAAINNIPKVCPAAGRVFVNTYQADIPLYLDGGEVLYSREGTCQGDPLAMAFYALATVPLAAQLGSASESTAQIWYADDDAAADKIQPLRRYWSAIEEAGPQYGYYPNAKKTVLLVRPHLLAEAQEAFAGTGVRIQTDGVRYLGGAIGSQQFQNDFVLDRVAGMCRLVKRLAGLAVTQPQAAYRLFVASLQSRWTFLQRVVPADPAVYSPLDRAINDDLLPALTGHTFRPDGALRQLLSLPLRNGGLAMRIGSVRAEAERLLCCDAIDPMVTCVVVGLGERRVADVISTSKALAVQARGRRRSQQLDILTGIKPDLSDQQRLLVDVAGEGGVSTWLGTPPSMHIPGSVFNKSDFRDALCLRYDLSLDGVALSCVCGGEMSSHHALTCPSGGYPTQRHNELRDLLADALGSVVCDVAIEPPLMPLQGEAVSGSSADGARVDIRARGFWTRQQNAFFDVRVTHPRPSLLSGPEVAGQLSQHERQKKRQYADRINQVDRGSFTPLVFATNGQSAPECSRFLKTLAACIADKNRDLQYALVLGHLRSRISTSLIRWQITCFRGSRSSYARGVSGTGRHGFVTDCRALAHMSRVQ